MEPGNHLTPGQAENNLPAAKVENVNPTSSASAPPASSIVKSLHVPSAEPQGDSKHLEEEASTDQLSGDGATSGASGMDDDEWVWSNGTVVNTPAADRDELRHSDAGSGGQAEVAVDGAIGSSVNDVAAANLSGSTTSTSILIPTMSNLAKKTPEQHLSEFPMESNSTDLKLENNDLLSSDADSNLVSTPVLGSATDRTLKMLSTQVAGLSILPTNPDVVPSDAPSPLVPDEAGPEIRPPTPLKNDTINRNPSTSPISPALLQTLPLPQPPPAPPPKDVPPKDRVYLDPAPLTPGPSRSVSPIRDSSGRELPRNPQSGSSSEDDEPGDNTRSEIHNIFEQSNEKSSTSLTSSSGMSSPAIKHPVRSSSLSGESGKAVDTTVAPHIPPVVTSNSPHPATPRVSEKAPFVSSPTKEDGPQAPATVHQPPPPDEDLPFDFHRFLHQLRKGPADPITKFLQSFLREFAKKQWMVHEQVKIVHDFLNFIYGKIESCEVWRNVGEVEIDNAREGMEKLVMNRLYTQTFSPAIAPVVPPSAGGSRRSFSDDRFPGRRGQHQEDVERDEVLAQKVRIYGWIREEHLDIGDTVTGDSGRKFLDLAVNEMVKIGSYRAPRDKVICVLNCCKVIFGLLRHSNSDESADKFIPLLIYVVLRANPEHLVSNVQYILRFRNPDKLNGEAGYYLSSLMGAIQFIENLDRSSLTITDEEFEKNVEAAVAAIAERPPPPPPPLPPRRESYSTEVVSEKSRGGPSVTPRASMEGRHSTSSREGNDSGGESEEKAVAGLLRTIQRPLTTIGRIFSDGESSNPAQLSIASGSGPALTPGGGNTPRGSPGAEDSLLTAVGGRGQHGGRRRPAGSERLTADEAAARQASAETEEARRIQRREHENVVDILKAMFPALDKEIIGDVVSMKEGRSVSSLSFTLSLSLFPFRFVSKRYISLRKGRLRKIFGGR